MTWPLKYAMHNASQKTVLIFSFEHIASWSRCTVSVVGSVPASVPRFIALSAYRVVVFWIILGGLLRSASFYLYWYVFCLSILRDLHLQKHTYRGSREDIEVSRKYRVFDVRIYSPFGLLPSIYSLSYTLIIQEGVRIVCSCRVCGGEVSRYGCCVVVALIRCFWTFLESKKSERRGRAIRWSPIRQDPIATFSK